MHVHHGHLAIVVDPFKDSYTKDYLKQGYWALVVEVTFN